MAREAPAEPATSRARGSMMATKRKSTRARAKNKGAELERLSVAVWTLSMELERARSAQARKLAHVLEAVAHALDPSSTMPRRKSAVEDVRAEEALGRVSGEARAYLRARIGPVTPGEVYEALHAEIDTLLRSGCPVRVLEIAACSALRALGQRSTFDREQFRAAVAAIKAKPLDLSAPLDRWSVTRAALRAGGMSTSEVRKLDKARDNRARQKRNRTTR